MCGLSPYVLFYHLSFGAITIVPGPKRHGAGGVFVFFSFIPPPRTCLNVQNASGTK